MPRRHPRAGHLTRPLLRSRRDWPLARVIEAVRSRNTALAGGAGITALGIGLLAPILPAYAESLGASATLVGLLLAGFGIARLLVSLPAAWLAGRLGQRRLLVGSPAVMAPLAALCAAAGGFWTLALFCLIEGAAAAVYATIGTAAVASEDEPGRRGRSLATYQMAGLLGAALGPAIGGLIGQQFGLRAPFLLYAALAGLVAWWLHLRLGERPLSSIAEPCSDQEPGRGPGWRRWIAASLVGLWLLVFALMFTRIGVQLVALPLLGAWRLGLSPGQIGLALSGGAVVALLLFYPAGWLADRYSRKSVVVAGGLSLMGGLALLAGSGDYPSFVLGAGLLGAGSGLTGPGPPAHLTDLVPEPDRTTAVGLYRTFGDVGAALAPPLLGRLADQSGYGASLLASAALLFVGLVAFAWLTPAAPGVDPLPRPSRRDVETT